MTVLEALSGLDSAFLALETPSSRLHVAGIFVLGPKKVPAEAGGPPGHDDEGASGATVVEEIRDVVARRVSRVPRLHRHAVPMPFGLQPPFWIDDPDLDVSAHVRGWRVPSPGGPSELAATVGEILASPLPTDRPLWEMVVLEGLAGGRTAVVARLHHAILDGVSGASAMAAFLDLAPGEPGTDPSGEPLEPAARAQPGRSGGTAASPRSAAPRRRRDLRPRIRHALSSAVHHPEALMSALRRSADAIVEVAAQNRKLAAMGISPPPAPFSAPRTSFNGSLDAQRQFAMRAVPLADLERVRRAEPGTTVNDVILASVGGALARSLARRGEVVGRSLVALVPVSTRGPATVPESPRAQVGNYVSGMLVPLGTALADPVERLREVSAQAAVAKEQEARAGGDLLEDVLRAVPPVVVAAVMRGIERFDVFDRVAPPFNVAVSSIVVPDVTLWWAGRPVAAVYPAAPVASGFGLNVTAMTYKGTVHFGLVGCPRLVPDLDAVAHDLDDAVAQLVAAVTHAEAQA